MSLDNAKRYLEALENSQELQDELTAVAGNYVQIGQQRGFEFTQGEFYEALRLRLEFPQPPDIIRDMCLTVGDIDIP